MKRTRTCGSSCYTATEPACDCVCGGALHGAAGAANRERIKALTGGALPKNQGQMLVLANAFRRLQEVRNDAKRIGTNPRAYLTGR